MSALRKRLAELVKTPGFKAEVERARIRLDDEDQEWMLSEIERLQGRMIRAEVVALRFQTTSSAARMILAALRGDLA